MSHYTSTFLALWTGFVIANCRSPTPPQSIPTETNFVDSSTRDSSVSNNNITDSGTHPVSDTQTADASVARRSIRNVDFCNIGFPAPLPTVSNCRATRDVRHRPGEGIHSFEESQVHRVVYGDITGDQQEEAVIELLSTTRSVIIGAAPPYQSSRLLVAQIQGDQTMIFGPVITEERISQLAIQQQSVLTTVVQGNSQCISSWTWTGHGLERTPTPPQCSTLPRTPSP